jgi:hypothetical protein
MGVAPKTVRDWIRTDRVRWRPRGNQGRDVLVTPDMERELPGEAPGELDRLREALTEAREEVAGLRERCGRAEGQAETRAAHLASLEARLAATETALAEARKGWLERLLEALRRK